MDKGTLEGDPRGYFLLVSQQDEAADEFSISSLARRLWRGKLALVLFVIAFAAIAVFHAFTARPVYRSETKIVVRAEALQGAMSALRGQLGGLASIAGISLGNSGDRRNEFLAVLQSRQLAREFVAARNLLPILYFGSWNESTKTFTPDKHGRVPTLTDGADSFLYYCRIRDDLKSGLITVTVEWYDPELAASWASDYVAFANERLQQEAIRNANESIKYLNDEIARTTVEPIRLSLYRVLESRLNERMMATVEHEYAFKIIDRALAAQKHQFVRPRRAIEIVIGILCGLMFGSLFALWRHPAQTIVAREA